MTSRNNIQRGRGGVGEKKKRKRQHKSTPPKTGIKPRHERVRHSWKGTKGPSAVDFDPGHRLIRNYTFHRAMIITLTRITNGPRFRAGGGSTPGKI